MVILRVFSQMIHLNAPLFLNVEYSRSFIEEYPICATEKNIVMPYPTVDTDYYAGKLFLPGYPDVKRDKLIFYLGGMVLSEFAPHYAELGITYRQSWILRIHTRSVDWPISRQSHCDSAWASKERGGLSVRCILSHPHWRLAQLEAHV
jgi:hypothetical protein